MLPISRRTRNWTILLILIPALAYGAAKAMVWYSVRNSVQNVRESLSPFASLDYAKIASPVFGSFGVTGIRIKPRVFEDEISIGSALVHIDDPIEKFKFLRSSMDERLPTSLHFSLHDVRVPLTGDIAAWFGNNAASGNTSGASPPACDTGAAVTVADMKRMGYDELVGNVVLDYSYDRRSGGLNTYLKLTLQDMAELTLEGTIPASEVVFNAERVKGVPKFSDLSLSLQDLSWASRFDKYCSQAMGITEAQYIQKRMMDTRKAFEAADFDPSPELLAGLEKFTTGKATLTISLNPRDPISLTQLPAGNDPAYLIDSLGIDVMVDGEPVKNLGQAKKTEVAKAAEKKSEAREETFKLTPIQELPQYLKSRVQVFVTDGNVHRGYLDSIDADKLVITRHLVGGSATFNVSRKDVAKVLVMRP
ncbi:MAG: hypothetical protein WAL83_12425 [Arenicellales bacterium]